MAKYDSLGRKINPGRTVEEWLAAIKHSKATPDGRPYDYSIIKKKHIKSRDRIKYRCPIHGIQEVFAASHLTLQCGGCGREAMAETKRGQPSKRKLSLTQAIAKAKAKHPDLDYSKIKKYDPDSEWKLTCPEHGSFSVGVRSHIWHGKRGCAECAKERKAVRGKQASLTRRGGLTEALETKNYKLKKFTLAHEPATVICPEHGVFTVARAYYITQGSICPTCRKGGSKAEKILKDALTSIGKLGKVDMHRRDLIKNQEVDMFLPKHKVGIEINGVYYHNDLVKSRSYHKGKTEALEANGMRLLHFTDTELHTKLPLVVSMIHAKCGIFKHRLYGRATKAVNLTYKEAAEFANANHIQGAATGVSYIGLVANLAGKDRVVALGIFGKPRFNKNYDWELIRFCALRTCQVVGGLSKVVAAFGKEHKGTLLSYADRNYSSGGSYKTSGWDYLGNSEPSFTWYHKDGRSVSRYQAQKQNMPKFLDKFDADLSQDENMRRNGFWKVYNAGNLVFAKQL